MAATVNLRVSAFAGGALVAAMLALFVTRGVGQEPLRAMHPVLEYQALLLAQPTLLRVVLALDNLFVLAYASTFFALSRSIARVGLAGSYMRAARTCLLVVALLDLAENLHFLTMISAAELGIAPTSTELRLQHWESLLEFHLAHVGICLLGLALPRSTVAERTLRTCCLLSPLIGFGVYTMPPPLSQLLLFARFALFLYTLIAVGWLFGSERRTRGFARETVASPVR